MAKILPSIFGANIMRLQEDIDFLEEAGTQILHVDLMDGNFVSNIAFGPNQIQAMKENTTMLLDVHMMVQHPEEHLPAVLATGAEMISVHYEATPHVHGVLQKIKQAGRKAGIVLNPSTPETVLPYLLDVVDYVLIMTINPGQPGQHFLEEMLPKIQRTKKLIGTKPIQIEVDGGVDAKRAQECQTAGADLIVVGGALFTEKPQQAYASLKKALVQEGGKEYAGI